MELTQDQSEMVRVVMTTYLGGTVGFDKYCVIVDNILASTTVPPQEIFELFNAISEVSYYIGKGDR